MPFQLDADVATALAAVKAAGPGPALGDVQAHRDGLGANIPKLYEASYPTKGASVVQTDYETASADGHRVLLRWYAAAGAPAATAAPAVLYTHSGGMVIGQVADFDTMLHHYVAQTGVPFLSVEYRLYPEVRYPKALEDVYAGLVWLHAHAADLRVDPACIAVMGESAGGNLAAAVCIYARDRRGPAISKQLLVYPMLDDRSRRADAAVASFLTWTDVYNETGWDAYLGDMPESAIPATASPARLADAAGLPPAYLETGELDLFRDEILAYAALLWRATVNTELHVFPGLPHGYDLMMPAAKRTQEAMACRLRAIAGIPRPAA